MASNLSHQPKENRHYLTKNNIVSKPNHIETAHRRVFTEGPSHKTYAMRNETNDDDNDQTSFLEEEEAGRDGDDGVPIYSNSGVSQLLDH
jgi:hypothetical protein